MAIRTDKPIRPHSAPVPWAVSPAASPAPNMGASQPSKPRKNSGRRHSLGVPSKPASALPMASTVSGTVMERGDS